MGWPSPSRYQFAWHRCYFGIVKFVNRRISVVKFVKFVKFVFELDVART
jgi:hypothetical protein